MVAIKLFIFVTLLTSHINVDLYVVDEIIHQHTLRAADWFHGTLKKHPPWTNWTHDIYDAMRCIDHLPIR